MESDIKNSGQVRAGWRAKKSFRKKRCMGNFQRHGEKRIASRPLRAQPPGYKPRGGGGGHPVPERGEENVVRHQEELGRTERGGPRKSYVGENLKKGIYLYSWGRPNWREPALRNSNPKEERKGQRKGRALINPRSAQVQEKGKVVKRTS